MLMYSNSEPTFNPTGSTCVVCNSVIQSRFGEGRHARPRPVLAALPGHVRDMDNRIPPLILVTRQVGYIAMNDVEMAQRRESGAVTSMRDAWVAIIRMHMSAWLLLLSTQRLQ